MSMDVLWMSRLVLSAAVLTVPAVAQTEHKLTARELFYTPVTNVKPKAQTSKPARQAPKTKPDKPAVRRDSNGPSTTVPDEPVGVVKQRRDTTLEDGATIQTVSTLPPLALRYSILKRNESDEYLEVDPETVFRAGDRIRVSVQANDSAYLYIVQKGSSNSWDLLFPNEDTEHGSNRIERNRQYVIPSGARFTFDDRPGTERLFIVVSRQPQEDMESLIYSLSKPVSEESKPSTPKALLAQARPIDDGLIGRLRSQMLARDLVFEKVDESKPGPKKETAMYVATQDESPNARLVVDLSLNHR
jgi:hypothetical protein